ncbi:hypothetical protein EDD85DRAFT_940915 [Armillaria nabsnona]|nr:hypothetical protein EDD85DRAFT_940915 [Armillaria nabsnona]
MKGRSLGRQIPSPPPSVGAFSWGFVLGPVVNVYRGMDVREVAEIVVFILAEDASGVGFGRMLCLSSVPDAENQHYRSISECSHLAFDAGSQHFDNTSDSKPEYSHPISEVGESHAPEEKSSVATFLNVAYARRQTFMTMTMTQINALKRIEDGFKEGMKAETQDHAPQKDEALHVQLQSKWQQLSPRERKRGTNHHASQAGGLYVYRDCPERIVEAVHVTSEDKVERMENLLRRCLPPEADWKEELDAVQMLPEDASKPDVGDRDRAMERKPRGFRRVHTGLSISTESQALFKSFKKPWISTWRSHADAYSVYLNNFLPVLSRSTFDKSVEGISAEHGLL